MVEAAHPLFRRVLIGENRNEVGAPALVFPKLFHRFGLEPCFYSMRGPQLAVFSDQIPTPDFNPVITDFFLQHIVGNLATSTLLNQQAGLARTGKQNAGASSRLFPAFINSVVVTGVPVFGFDSGGDRLRIEKLESGIRDLNSNYCD